MSWQMAVVGALGAAQYKQQGAYGKFNQAKNNRDALVIEQNAEILDNKLTLDLSTFDKKFRELEGSVIVNTAKSGVTQGGTAARIRLANFIMSRQPDLKRAGLANINNVNRGNFAFIKYGNLPFADVIRGAQFDKRAYNAMLTLKGLGKNSDIIPGINALENMGWKKVGRISNNKLAFSLSPQMKLNYDFGGYNAVGIWDRRRPDKIRFIATDVPNAAVESVTGGKIKGLKYVSSREITITDKKVREMLTIKPVDPARREAALRGWETRRKNLKKAGIKPLPIADDLLDRNPVIGKGRYQKMQDLASKRKGFNISAANRLSKIGRRLPGALGLAMNAWAMYDMYKMATDE